MALNFHHMTEFSPDGKLFASLDEQGLLKIWDVETNELKQKYVPNLHLAAPCTSLTWVPISQKRKKDKTKNDRRSSIGNVQNDILYLALGTNKGGVVMYSYASGTIERKFKGTGHTAQVSNITYDGSNFLYTCGHDSQIVVWSVSEEKQVSGWSIGNEKPFSIVSLPESNSVAVGGRQLKLYSIGDQELRQAFTGHTSDVNLLKHFVYNNVEFIISASKMERIVCLWAVKNRGKTTCTFLMEDIAYSISCKVDDEGNLQLTAVTRSGVIHFYENSLESLKPEKPIKPIVTIQIASNSDETITPIPAIAGVIQVGKTNHEILFAYGDKQFLQFERIEPNFAEKLQVIIRNDPKKLLTKSEKKKSDNSLKLVTPEVNNTEVEYRSAATVSKKQKKPVQLLLETRLQNLNFGEVPQAKSKVQLLMQALHSKDSHLLRNVLGTNDTKVMQLTLQKLPIQYVGILVNELTQLMQLKSSNVEMAANWLKLLVRIHSSQLMALGPDDLLTKFGPCLGIIEHRMNCLKEISKVSGRLDLLINQIKRNTDEDELNNESVLIYKDEDSSNSDLEDTNMEHYSSNSDLEDMEGSPPSDEDDPEEEMEIAN